jgi:uncharacterized protein
MSQENVALVRSYYEAVNRSDRDAVSAFLAPEVEFHLAGLFPDLARVYRGRVEVQTFLDQFAEPWRELSIEPERFIDVDARVLVFLRFRARGRDGIVVELPLAHLWTMSDGRAVRMDAYSDQLKALEAVGLRD